MACLCYAPPSAMTYIAYHNLSLESQSIEMKYFGEHGWESRSRVSLPDQDIAHVPFPTLTGLARCHYLQVVLKIINLHIREKLRVAQINGVVLAPRSLEICQKLWPDLLVTPAVFFLSAGPDPHHKSNALHRIALPL